MLVPRPHGTTGDFAGIAESLQLVEGESRCDGRLEVSASPGAWARMQAGLWGARDASVVCQQLGCGVLEKVYTVPVSGTAGLQGLRSAGTEENLAWGNVSGTAAALTGSPEEVAVVCSGECLGKGRGVPATPSSRPSPVPSVPRRQPSGEAGGRPWALRRAGGGLRQWHLGHRLPGNLGPPGCHRRLPPAGLRNGAGGTQIGSLRSRHGAAVARCRWLRRDRGVALGLPALGTARLPARWRGGSRLLRSVPCVPSSGTRGTIPPGVCVCVCAWPSRAMTTPPRCPLAEQLSLRLAGGSSRCRGHLEVLYNGTWGRVCVEGTSPATAAAVCWQLGCGDGGTLVAAPAWDLAPAWLAWVGCKEGARSLWRCLSAPWRLQTCSPGRDVHIVCDKDSDGTSGTPTPSLGSRCPEGATCTGSSARAGNPPRWAGRSPPPHAA